MFPIFLLDKRNMMMIPALTYNCKNKILGLISVSICANLLQNIYAEPQFVLKYIAKNKTGAGFLPILDNYILG
jgi:hypothetical protein